MKRTIFSLLITAMATVGLQAQQIAVVQADGSTTVHSLLVDAIEAAEAGSVIYLPGGSFPIDDSVKVTKPVTIMGIGHKWKSDNAEEYGYTTVTGNLQFRGGSDGSAVMGIYLTGNIYIGINNDKPDNVLVRWCNVNEVQVNSQCRGTVVNQNYIRNGGSFSGAGGEFTNNIAGWVVDLDNGVIAYNLFTSTHNEWADRRAMRGCDQCAINHNIILDWANTPHSGVSSTAIGNMAWNDWGDDPINMNGIDWSEVFVNHAGVTPNSDYHFKEEYKKYESQCGIYAGGGFSDSALPPIPYIVEKQVPQQTDADGNLNIKIRVRAGE